VELKLTPVFLMSKISMIAAREKKITQGVAATAEQKLTAQRAQQLFGSKNAHTVQRLLDKKNA